MSESSSRVPSWSFPRSGSSRRASVRAALAATLLGVVTAGCGGELLDLGGTAPKRFGDEAAEAQDVFALTNQARAEAGLHPLVWDGHLATVAKEHAVYQQAVGEMTHTGANGQTLGQRLVEAGVSHRRASENVAWGWNGGAEAVFHAWVGSPLHHDNLLHPDMTHTGVGAVHRPNGPNPGPWWTQDFILPR